ncbi:hypothetical protein HPULCUR_000604 [Helicostylum pulchrum]|uniref:Dynamin-binding protein n=1 Tax=Helicostylum pulchrum TaxID=562976 RepID=A0ABP9XKC9_9FUNG
MLCKKNTMPRRITAVTKNISDLSDHFPLKRNHSDLPASKTTPSLWSSSNGSSTTAEEYEKYGDEEDDEDDQDEEDEEEEDEDDDDEILVIPNLGIRAVPRTGSFVTELSKRLAISEKKGEPVSHTILSMRRSAPNFEEPSLPVTTSMHHIVNRKSVPNSSSSPSLVIPPAMIKRSTTGTSISSSNSSVSASSNKRNNWHFTHWFSHPPLPSSLTTTVESQQPQPSASKRARIIQELISTEKNYQTDMELIKEIYYDEAHQVFSKIEIKHIFINLLDIISFEKEFLSILDSACCEQESEITIGTAFSIMMNRMDQLYGDYCKKHEDAASKIQEISSRSNVQAFFLKCKEKLQGRTMCWDLPSLLIKPVQRVLKYPLLLKEIVASTPEHHPDYDQLIIVTHEIQQMADHINEMKRRKDMVEQLIIDKKKIDRNVVQGINKKFTRRVHRKKQSSAGQDASFDHLYKQFESRQEIAKQFEKGAQDWLVKIKQNISSLSDLVHGLEAVYGDSDGIGLRSMRTFKKLVSQLETNSVETNIQEAVYNRIESYLKLFKNPLHIIQKRNRKLIDYDRARHLISKGEVPDKQLQISAEQYISLNAHLLDELPIFLSLTVTYFDIIVSEFARVQATYWRKSKLEWKSLTIEQPFGREHTWVSIESDYRTAIKRMQPRIDEITSKPRDSGCFILPNNLSTVSIDQAVPIPKLKTNKKYDSLFSESQPVFQCIALVDYESPEKLQIQEGDLIQIWLPTNTMNSDSATVSTNASSTEWWYGSLANNSEVYGWLPSNICERV